MYDEPSRARSAKRTMSTHKKPRQASALPMIAPVIDTPPPQEVAGATSGVGAPRDLSPEELAGLLGASGFGAAAPPPSPQTKRALRRKLLIAALIAAGGLGASIMSCIGQSFSYRQARALEGIEQQLKDIRTRCVATPVEPAKSL